MKAKGGYSQGGARATGWQYSGGQGVHQVSIAKMKSEGHEQKYRTTIDGETQDEPLGQRWGKVESALLRRRRSQSPTAPRCLRQPGRQNSA
jgi:hypothetical protein